MELNEILSKAMAMRASDIHLKHGIMPVVRIHGKLYPIDKTAERLTGEQIAQMAASIMTPGHQEKFNQTHEIDMGYGVAGLGRFRVNIFKQRGTVGMVIRAIPYQVRTLEDLKIPPVVAKLTAFERGIILVTGATGSGKSTTLASMIDFINHNRTGHILTIEDPIEYLIRDRKCIINQRELGLDTMTFSSALRQALRQDPDVILIGEMRDVETIQTALLAAETGHLVLSTLHTSDTTETINRILNVFEPHQQPHLRIQLAANLRAVISQRLLTRADNEGQVPACEVMIVNTRIREMILDPKKSMEIPQAIEEGANTLDMQTFDQSIMRLLRQGLITYDEAKGASTNPEDFDLRYKGITSQDGQKWQGFDGATGAVEIPSIPSIEIHTMPQIPNNEPIDNIPLPPIYRKK